MAKEKIAPIREELNLNQVMVKINKRFGANTIILGTQRKKDPPRIPTGIFSIDYCCGGGLPLWGSMCGWGKESGGKTLLGIKLMRSAMLICWRCFKPKVYCSCSQKPLSMRSVYMDSEGSFDMDWAQQCGVDPSSYLLSICDSGEQYIDVAAEALKADDCGLLIFDSLAALTPEVELEASASDQFMGKQAAMIGRAVRKLKTQMLMEMKKKEKPCAIYFINQMRSLLGVMYGSNETMSGGWAMKHEFSLLLRLVKKPLSKGKAGKGGGDDQYINSERLKEQASRHSFEIKKEKVLTLSGVGEFLIVKENLPDLSLKKGTVDDFDTLLKYARIYEVVTQDGKGWKYLTFKANTHDDIKRVWRENPNEYIRCTQEIIKRAKERLG